MGVRFIDVINPVRWKSYFVYLLRKFLKGLDESDWTPEIHEIEQYHFRLLSCPDCVGFGTCVHCGCKVPERMWNRKETCSEMKWQQFMDKDSWEKHKKAYGITFKINYE